jgi:hypothetical protein
MKRLTMPGTRGALILTWITLAAGIANVHAGASTTPDFGPNVTIFDPSMSVDQINTTLQTLATQSTGFDEIRHAVYFMPGTYGSAAGAADPTTATGFINSPLGFMETVQGLGATPDDVTINGNLRVGTATGNALGTFWRSLSNVQINPIETDEPAHTMRYNTSQASPLRRLDIVGNLDLSGGLAAGNLLANSRISGSVTAGFEWLTDIPPTAGQFYYYLRDSQIGSWQGHFVDFVFSGVEGAPPTNSNPNDITTLRTTPISRDAPFLYVDHQNFMVFVPAARTNVSGIHWGMTWQSGESLPIQKFYIAQPTDSAETLNKALSQGKNLILTPGVYKVDEAIHVTRPNTVIMGMGLATVTPTTGTEAIEVDDIPGVIIAAITVDANTTNSNVLVRIGTLEGCTQRHARGYHGDDGGSNPTTLSDVFVRVGGSYAGNATTSFEINQDNALIDHSWLWRADHGNAGTTGWTVNTGAHGLVVNGDHVTALGLWVEHYQQSQVVWNGNDGQTIFYESEAPYDPPNQAAYMNGGEDGYPHYEVTDGVTSHYATGMVMMTFFQAKTPVYVHSAIKTVISPHVQFHDMTDGVLLGVGGIQNIVNDSGGSVDAVNGPPAFVQGIKSTSQLMSFP